MLRYSPLIALVMLVSITLAIVYQIYLIQFPPNSQVVLIALISGILLSLSISGALYLLLKLYGGAARELITVKKRNEYLVSASPALIVGLSPMGVTRYMSPSVSKLTGFSEQELIGESWWELLFLEEERSKVIELLGCFQDEEQVEDYEMVLLTKEGVKKAISWTSKNRYDDEGDLEEIIIFGIDVTQKNEYQEQLVKAKEDAENANRAKSAFLAGMSHEIRTPMNGIIGTATLLAQTELNNKQTKYLKIIQSSGQILLQIINEVLDYSKIEANKLVISHRIFALQEEMEEQVALFQPLAKEKDLQYVLDYDQSLPEFIVSDNVRIRQILANLISNAIKFSVQGQIKIQIVRQDDRIKLSVFDNGVGISADQIDKVFGVFEQISSGQKTTKSPGTGLGLAICKRLAEMMDGEIGVESTEGEGSVFWFAVPLKIPSEQEVAEHKKEHAFKSSDVLQGTDLFKDRKVLVAEDVITNQFVITDMLEKLGFIIDIANNGEEAVNILTQNDYDLILMDCNMPVMDGFEATSKIRTEICPNIPIIALTANAFEQDRQKCLEAGMNDFIGKPIDQGVLVAVLEKWLVKGHEEMRYG